MTDVFNPKSKEEQAEEKSKRVVDEEAVKALQLKVAKPLFEVNLRLVASAGSPFQANDILDGSRRIQPVWQSDAQRFQNRDAAQSKEHRE